MCLCVHVCVCVCVCLSVCARSKDFEANRVCVCVYGEIKALLSCSSRAHHSIMPENAADDKVCLALKQRECRLQPEAMLKTPVRPLVPWLSHVSALDPGISVLEAPGISALEEPWKHLLHVRPLVPCQRGQLHCL